MIKDAVEQNAFNSPNKSFLEFSSNVLSCAEFNDNVNNIVLSKTMPNRARYIAVCLSDPVQLLLYIFACNRLKKIPVIFPSNSNIEHLFDNSISFDYKITDSNCMIQYKKRSKYFGYKYDEDDIQCVIFTSGTSGLLKGVELTFGNIYYSAKNLSSIYPFNNNDVYLNVMPLYHVSGLSIIFRSIYFNFLSILNLYNKREVLDVIKKKKVTCLSVVPKMIFDFSNDQDSENVLSKLNFLLIGGDMINQNHYNYLTINKINAYVSYGATETASSVAGYWIKNQKKYIQGFIGKPHPNVSLSISSGCIKVKSDTVMKRYYGCSLSNNVYQSTDQADMINSNIFFIGRSEDQIVSGGKNINLKYVQNKYNALNLNIDAVVTSFKNLEWGDSVVLLYESKKECRNYIKKIKKSLTKCLPKYMIPKHIINIPNIPRYENGKVNYDNLKAYVKNKIQ